MPAPTPTQLESSIAYYVSRGMALSVSMVFAGYVLLFLFKEGGGFLSDVGFLLILPIAVSGLSRPYVPSELFWPIFIVLQLLYGVGLFYAYSTISRRIQERSTQKHIKGR